jgi:hypothetical protein
METPNLAIGQTREIAELFNQTAEKLSSREAISGSLRKVIVRSREAGVLYGQLVSYNRDGSLVHLANARQMWSWTAKTGGTLLDCAIHGVKGGKFSATALSVIVIGACAIIDCTHTASETIEAQSWN